MDNNFAFNLKHIRQEKGLTQDQLAKIIGKDYSTIGKWENGTRSPIMEDVIRLADILNVDIKSLISDNYVTNNDNFDELAILFDKHKDILTESDKAIIKTIIEQRKKEIDKELDK